MKTAFKITLLACLTPLLLNSARANDDHPVHHHYHVIHHHHHPHSDFSSDVDHTFRGVGADLEQTFTGERTVDR